MFFRSLRKNAHKMVLDHEMSLAESLYNSSSDMTSMLRKVRIIDIITKRLVEGLVQGGYQSVFKGRGIEFSDVREYVPGDDIRSIDWNITARMNFPFVKEFIEERNLTVYIAIDLSASNDFGNYVSKRDAEIEAAAMLMMSALKNNDYFGLIFFTDVVERFFPPRNNKNYFLMLVREMLSFKAEHKSTNLSSLTSFLSNVVKKRSIIFVLSDFMGDKNKVFSRHLKYLNQRHDLVLVNVFDDREDAIPNVGYVRLMDNETGEVIVVNTSDESFRKNYSRLMAEKAKSDENLFRKLGVDYLRVRSGDDYRLAISRFFYMRKKRLVR